MTLEQWLSIVGGAMLIIVGLLVAVIRHRNLAALAFASTATGVGLASTGAEGSAAGQPIFPFPPFLSILTAILVTCGWWGLLWFFPRTLTREDRRDVLLAIVYGAVMATVTILFVGIPLTHFDASLGSIADRVWNWVAYAGLWGVGAILALRARRTRAEEAGVARSLGIMAVGLVLFSVGTFADVARVARGEISTASGIASMIYMVVPTALWVVATRGAHPAIARNVVIGCVVLYVGGSVFGGEGAFAIGSVVGALTLGYAVLRGQIEGLDLKVRFAISKSTVAAAFIAVFFVASAIAQQFFSDKLGGTYVGIVAAGLLVFAIAPLQRAAERLAERAVPVASPTQSTARPDGADPYRRAVRLALRDRKLSHDEEVELASVAHALGLTAPEATRIRLEVEREMGASGGGSA